MPSELATAFIRIRPDMRGFKQEAAATSREAGSVLGKVFAVAFGTVVVEELAQHFIKVAAVQDAMFAKVQQLTKSAGAQWEVYGQTVQEAIIKKSESSGFAVDQLANAYGRLIQQTKNTKQALALLTTASDVARARGTAVTMVATSLSRALGGNAQALSRLGIIVPKYTAAQDAIKVKLHDVALAEQAQTQQRAKVYDGTIRASQAVQEYAAMNKVQLAQIKENLRADLDAAKASDKLVGAQKTLAEVATRFKGQGAIFGATAAGQADRFQISVHELEVTLGEHLLPLLSSAAQKGREWANALDHSSEAGNAAQAVATNVANAVGGVAEAVQAAYPAIHLVAEGIGTVIDALGGGTILTTYAAYKGIVIVLGTVARIEKQIAVVRAAAAAPIATQVAATTALTSALEANTVAKTQNAAASNMLVLGQVRMTATAGTATGVIEAETVALEAQKVASAEGAASMGLLGAATSAFGPQAIVLGVAALAGGIYWLSTRESQASKDTKALTSAFGDLVTAQKEVKDTAKGIADSHAAVSTAEIARRQATLNLQDAQRKLNQDSQTHHEGDRTLTQDELNVAAAADQWRQANRTLLESQGAVKKSSEDNAKAIADQKKKTDELVTSELKLAHDTPTQIAGAGRGYAALIKNGDFEGFAKSLEKIAGDTEHVSAATRFNAARLAEYTREIGRMPDDKTITLTLNDTVFYAKLQKARETIGGAAKALFDVFTQTPQAESTHGGAAQLAEKAARQLTPITTTALSKGAAAARVNVAAEFKKALTEGVQQAKQTLGSIGQTLGDDIGAVLDARLAAAEANLKASPAAHEVKQLLADIQVAQNRITSRQQANTSTDAARALADLQRAFGPGAHTAEQDAQLQDAQNAVLDAQDQTLITSEQARADSLQKGLDQRDASLQKRNEMEKAAATRRLADLNDSLNRGLITEKQYVQRLNGLLLKEGVNYKTAGARLGSAFASGFKEQLAGALAEAKIIANLTPAQRGKGTGNAPTITNPLAAARAAAAQARQSNASGADPAVAANTAEMVKEIKKLGGLVEKTKTSITVSIPPDTSPKKTAEIIKLQKALQRGAG